MVAVVSTTEDRDVMVSCLQLGAADYMIKPLRHNEVRNLWARVYWWRRVAPPPSFFSDSQALLLHLYCSCKPGSFCP